MANVVQQSGMLPPDTPAVSGEELRDMFRDMQETAASAVPFPPGMVGTLQSLGMPDGMPPPPSSAGPSVGPGSDPLSGGPAASGGWSDAHFLQAAQVLNAGGFSLADLMPAPTTAALAATAPAPPAAASPWPDFSAMAAALNAVPHSTPSAAETAGSSGTGTQPATASIPTSPSPAAVGPWPAALSPGPTSVSPSIPSASVTPTPTGTAAAPEYEEQLATLAGMGFTNREANLAALRATHGNVAFAVERLLQ